MQYSPLRVWWKSWTLRLSIFAVNRKNLLFTKVAIVNITLYSFGFKHGHPQADLVWDVRFLPNPFWVPALKPHTGKEAEVARYVLENESGSRFLALLEPLLLFLLDEYAAGGRESVTLAVGCTGGKHRSVAVVEHLRFFFAKKGLQPAVSHRDIDKE
jgi:RNase adaptor protein for sRNA GlmZ degradation